MTATESSVGKTSRTDLIEASSPNILSKADLGELSAGKSKQELTTRPTDRAEYVSRSNQHRRVSFANEFSDRSNNKQATRIMMARPESNYKA